MRKSSGVPGDQDAVSIGKNWEVTGATHAGDVSDDGFKQCPVGVNEEMPLVCGHPSCLLRVFPRNILPAFALKSNAERPPFQATVRNRDT
jgi:hypothetical protein